MTTAGTVRIRGYTGAGHTSNVYDSGTFTPFPAGLTLEDTAGLNVPIVVFPAVTARYWWIELTDTSNPANVVDVARVIIAAGYTPAINMTYGSGIALETRTERAETDGGATIFDVRPVRRILTGVLEHMTDAEALHSYFRMGVHLGTSGQLFVAWDPADTTYRYLRSFLCTLQKPNALTQPYLARHSGAFACVEEL
jgi:hypothetical protein